MSSTRRCVAATMLPVLCIALLIGLAGGGARAAGSASANDAGALVAAVIDQTRASSSVGTFEMRVHRPDWERASVLMAWTRGREDALIRFVEPARDAGNATLKLGEQMWTFTPRLNRTIRLPFSLMSQSWAGSDFSYSDLSRSDQLLQFYELTLGPDSAQDGHVVHTVIATPLPDAPVVWGREELVIRDDYVLLSHTFFDQEQKPLKRLETLAIGEFDGRVMPTRLRMTQLEEEAHYTELEYREIRFDVELEDSRFTLFELGRGGRK